MKENFQQAGWITNIGILQGTGQEHGEIYDELSSVPESLLCNKWQKNYEIFRKSTNIQKNHETTSFG